MYRFENETAARHENQNATKLKKKQHVGYLLYEPHYMRRKLDRIIIILFRVFACVL